ncbi:hypothetical protein ACROYT_G007236 [Oculina patagonica]
MMIKRPPTSTKVRIKAWQSKFFVLRDKTQNLTQRLEYYKDETAFAFQKPVEYSFHLDSIVYIGETQSSKAHCYPIMVVCNKQGAITVGCDTEKAMKDWLAAINRVAVKVGGTSTPDIWAHISSDNSPGSTPELFRRVTSDLPNARSRSCHNLGDMSPNKPRTATSPGYFVTTRLTPHSEKNNIRGDYILCVTEEEVSLQSAVDRSQTVVTWSVGHLRGFKSEPAVSAGVKDMQLLTLKVGRRSATGEGIFQFFTKHGDTIADEIRRHSQHAFKSAAEKRDAFRRKSTNSSETMSPPGAHPTRKLPRTMTAPPERIASALQKGNSMDNARSVSRQRAKTNPLPFLAQSIQENGSATQDVRAVIIDSEKDASVSSDESRPRSLTETSIEKGGDDDVFLTRQPYTEIDGSDDITEESEVDAYIDLLSDETAEPIHISDPVPSRKISSDSFTSTCSFGSEEGGMRSNSSLPRNFPGAQLIPEENEMDSEGYIKCEALQTGPAENSLDGNGNVVDYFASEKGAENQVCQISGSQSVSSCSVDTTTAKNGSLDISHAGARINRKMRESLFSQIKEPNCGNFPPKPKLEKEQALKSENVFPPKPSTEDDAPRNEVDSRQNLLDKLRAGDPEASKTMFEKIIAQMEKPQQHDVNELFPAVRPKRNSIGGVTPDTFREVQQRATTLSGGKGSHFTIKKHSVIEKSKSTCEGFGPRALSPGPPPLPVRPDPADVTRRRSSSSSIGDLSEEILRRPELAAAHRSTFFAKGMRSIDPHTLLFPHKTNIDTSHLTGEAAIQARLLEKTEIRDEQAQCSTNQRRNSAVDEVGSCPITDGGTADESAFDASEKGSCKTTESVEDDGQNEVARRKDSKASKFVKKVWKLAPKPRRGSNESREVCEEFSEKPRRDSLSPGDAMDIQGRFSGSEPSTPETSPQMSRKASKSSPKSSRKTSREEKLKKDKESPEITQKLSSASKMLRKVTKGSDAKKDESAIKKTSKEEKKDAFTSDNTAKHLPSSNKEKHKKWVPHEKTQKDLKDKKSKSNHERDELFDASCQIDGQSELASDMIDSQCALPNEDNIPAPALPPRKKFDPPPLPPRQAKSPTSFTSSAPPSHPSTPHHSGRTSQPAAPSTREGRRHSGQKGVSSVLKEEFLPPPPVPPRRENNQSPPDSKKMTSERSSARAPVIQLTCSSPENKQDSVEKQNSDSEEDMTDVTADQATEQNPPALSDTPQSPDSLSHPVPRRPPKGERRTQAKEFFRSHASQRVPSPSSDSEYGNIDEIRLGMSASEHEATSCKERSPDVTNSSRQEDIESNYINKTSSGPLSLEASRVIKSQREAMRLKINLMKESSVDEDFPLESDDGGITSVKSEDIEEQSTPKRPSTPLSIQRSPLTISSVSIT